MYKLEAENFSLELDQYMAESRLRIKVSSCGFFADTVISADELYMGEFSVSLNEFYETLSGSVKLQDLTTDSFIELTAKVNVYISVVGQIDNGHDCGHVFYHQLTLKT